MRALPVFLSLSTFLVVGCQVVGGFEDFSDVGNFADPTAGAGGVDAAGAGGDAGASAGEGGSSDAGSAGSEAAGAAGNETAGAGGEGGAGAGGAVAGGAGAAGAPPCPDPSGPLAGLGLLATQRLDGSCFYVQRLETNVADYRKFITEHTNKGIIDGCPGPVPPLCADGSCGTPGSSTCPPTASCSCPQCWGAARCALPEQDKLPVVCVNQCGARTYCESRGLRLCAKEELEALCAEDGNTTATPRPYPYGFDYQAKTCVSAPPLEEPGTKDCESPNGAEDVLGNVSEWTACTPLSLEDQCQVWGTDGAVTGAELTCQNYGYTTKASDGRRDLGLRCCADAPL
jgi:formylglycine-generating enzyme required for sulfatase activity